MYAREEGSFALNFIFDSISVICDNLLLCGTIEIMICCPDVVRQERQTIDGIQNGEEPEPVITIGKISLTRFVNQSSAIDKNFLHVSFFLSVFRNLFL